MKSRDLRPTSQKFMHLIWATFLFVATKSAVAITLGSDNWQLHGFISQGFIFSSGNQVFGNSRQGSVDFTEIGANISARLSPNFLVSAQGLYRRAGASDTQGLRLDFALADYSANFLDSTTTLGIRAGRIKIPYGLYNETRDVIWTRPTVFLPQSTYFDTLGLRQAMLAADGGLLYGRYVYQDHRFSTEFMAAEPQLNTPGISEFLTGLPSARGSFGGDPLLLGRALYEWKGGRGRLMFTMAGLDRRFESLSPSLPNGNVKSLFSLVSAQFNTELFSLTSEYGWIDSQRSGFVPVPLTNISESYYVQGEYRFAPNWTAVLRYDVFHVNRDDPDGNKMAALTGLPRHRFFAKDLTVGARWEFAHDWLIAAEYHHIDGTAWLSTVDNPSLLQGGGAPDWDMMDVMMSYRF